SQTPEDTATEPAVEPVAAEKTFNMADGLQWKLLLSEPLITQPLMISFDAQGRLWLVEYRQYPNPEGLKVLSKDRHWRVVYDSVPKPPGAGGLVGRDRISIHEDKDNDGNYETHHVFVDGLNIATSVLPVANGAWVLNPPYLLFYADQDQDLKADGPPEVHLEGFGLEDTHSVVNNLTMGPDGWIYGAQGSTVSGAMKAPGSADKPIQSLGQAIWRYHPQTRKYEIFAEGGGNAFGVAFDDRGEVFSGHNGGDTRGFHYYQGGYYRKGFSKHGSLSNPHSYGYLEPMQ
ncbi:MAG: PVC-type heme-binding CxxCH protein, partial [Pirellula sp.]